MNENEVRNAIETIRHLMYAADIDTIQHLTLAEKALEKQLAIKPNFEGDGYAPDGSFVYDMWECPKCGTCYEVEYDNYDYCPICGQKIEL